LLKEHFTEAEADVFEELDNGIVRYITDHTDEDLLDGCIYLAVCNPALPSGLLPAVIEEKVVNLLSTGNPSLASTNKVLALAMHMRGANMRTLCDKLPGAAATAVENKLYRPSDATIFRELLDASAVNLNDSARNRLLRICTSIPPADDWRNGLETVWQRMVFLNGAPKRGCDLAKTATAVAEILSDLKDSDMHLASGLPAMGMDILFANDEGFGRDVNR
jgi:hypothetical protein